MKTFVPKLKNITRDWHLVDAEGRVLGAPCVAGRVHLDGQGKTDLCRFSRLWRFRHRSECREGSADGERSSQTNSIIGTVVILAA